MTAAIIFIVALIDEHILLCKKVLSRVTAHKRRSSQRTSDISQRVCIVSNDPLWEGAEQLMYLLQLQYQHGSLYGRQLNNTGQGNSF